MRKISCTVSMLALTVFIAACDKKPATSTAPSPPAQSVASALPAGFFLATEPEAVVAVKDAKPGAKVGDKVTLVGRIGGSKEPFVDGRAIFTLVDQRVLACGEGSEPDACKTPWDFCCEPRKELTASSATVRVVGSDGQPLKTALMNVGGLKPLARVAVVGIVAQAEGGALVVNASGLYVTK